MVKSIDQGHIQEDRFIKCQWTIPKIMRLIQLFHPTIHPTNFFIITVNDNFRYYFILNYVIMCDFVGRMRKNRWLGIIKKLKKFLFLSSFFYLNGGSNSESDDDDDNDDDYFTFCGMLQLFSPFQLMYFLKDPLKSSSDRDFLKIFIFSSSFSF